MPSKSLPSLKISPNIKELLIPVVLILTMSLLYIFVILKGYSSVNTQLTDLRQANVDKNTLTTKLAELQQVDKSVLDKSNVSVLAMPKDDPVILMINQLNSLASQKTATISGINFQLSGGSADKGLTKARLSMVLGTPDVDTAVEVIKSIMDIAPVSTIDKLSVTQSQRGGIATDFDMYLYWAPLPSELPTIEKPIQTLTADETNLLEKLAKLKAPNYINLSPQSPSGRTNPFN